MERLGGGKTARGGGLGRKVLALLVGVLAVVGALAWWRVGPAPAVEIEPAVPGLGPATPVVVRAAEPGRGLSTVAVEVVQGDFTATLAERSYPPRPFWAFWGPRTAADEIAFEVGWKTHPQLKQGEATLRVRAGRAPTWLRRPEPAVTELELPVRRSPPTLAVTSSQVNVAQGGSGAVVYRLGPGAVKDGVEVGEWWFPGYPLPGAGPSDAASADAASGEVQGGEGRGGERFALFAVPYDVGDPSGVRLVAEDVVGNRAEAAFINRFDPKPLRRDTIELSDAFMARVVPEILAYSPEIEDRGELLANYLAVNGELRRINAEKLRHLAAESRPEFLWEKPFRQLPNTQVMASFADRRTYRYQGREVDRQDHLGFDLASVQRAPILAANRGVVVHAGYLGIYGNTVVVDHGYGLQTLYAHLSSIAVAEGETVEAGQSLGQSGQTGLAGGDHLHFSFLLQGLPVRPLEWWDPKWIADHLKARLGPALPFSPD